MFFLLMIGISVVIATIGIISMSITEAILNRKYKQRKETDRI